MAQSSFARALLQITLHFQNRREAIWTSTLLSDELAELREGWNIARSTTMRDLVSQCVEAKLVRRLDFQFPHRWETRFTGTEVPISTVLLSLKKNSYFCHASAMEIHGLGDPCTAVYLNHEQRPHVRSALSQQASIDTAFKSHPRISNNVVGLGDYSVCLVNGMHTGQLGVVEIPATIMRSTLAPLRVTDVERTLIDIAVRPVYAGGVEAVLEAYRRASARADVSILLHYLSELDYVYPYHQAIGWYLENAGFRLDQVAQVASLPMQFQFYLAHRMDRPVLNEKWQLYVASAFADRTGR